LGRIELPVTPCGYPNHAIDPTRCPKSIQIKSTHDAWRTKIMLPAKVPILTARQGGLFGYLRNGRPAVGSVCGHKYPRFCGSPVRYFVAMDLSHSDVSKGFLVTVRKRLPALWRVSAVFSRKPPLPTEIEIMFV
jgi:hypothetical protein